MNTTTDRNEIETKQAELVEQIRKLEEQKAALIEEQKAAERKAREEAAAIARKAQQEAALKAWQPKVDALVAALKAAGFESAKWTAPSNDYDSVPDIKVLPVGKYDADFAVNIVAMHDSSRTYRPSFKGWRINVGNYGNIKGFPEKKDGTFNYEKIAAEVKQRWEATEARKTRERKAKATADKSRHTVAELARKYGHRSSQDSTWVWYDHSINIDPSTSDEDKVWVNLGKWHLTGDQAEKIMSTLKELGLLPEAGKNM